MRRLLGVFLSATLVGAALVPGVATAGTETEYAAQLLIPWDYPDGWSDGWCFPEEHYPPIHCRDMSHKFWSQSDDWRVTGWHVVPDISVDATWSGYPPVRAVGSAYVARIHSTLVMTVWDPDGNVGTWEGTAVGWIEYPSGNSTLFGRARGTSGSVEGLIRVFEIVSLPESIVETGYIIEK